MNCTECREQIAAHLDHLLDAKTAFEFEQHLSLCAECRGQTAACADLSQRLTAHGAAAAHVALAAPVMRRIHDQTTTRPSAPSARFARWWLGVGAAAAASVALVVSALLLAPRESKAQASDVMTRGITAAGQLTSVHLQGRLRAPPADNFSVILAKSDFTAIAVWKELTGQKRWRIEKPGRVAWMDGQSTLQYLRPSNLAVRIPTAARSAFDTEWLQSIANIEETLTNALKMAQTSGWKIELAKTTDQSGAVHQLVTIDVPASVPAGDYLRNKFFQTAETRRLFRFSDQSGQLEALQIYLHEKDDYLLVFEVTQIDYNQAFAADVFSPALPADATISDLPRSGTLPPVDPKYTAMTAEQVARTFFEACARQDWNEVQVFKLTPLTDRLKGAYGAVTGVVSIGQPFSSAAGGQFVPYEVTLRSGATKKHNLALKRDTRSGRWFVDGGF